MIRNKHWQIEWLHLLFTCSIIPVVYFMTGTIWLAVTVAIVFYLIILWRKIFLIHSWLEKGMLEHSAPITSGILGQLVSLIYQNKKQTDEAHQQQKALTQQFHEIVSAIPSATVILNKNDEIEWANYSAFTLLGINGQRDIGIKIDSLLRQDDFINHLNANSSQLFEIQSPVVTSQTLSIQLVSYGERRRLLLGHNLTPHIQVQRSRKTFVANASHELRTPLTVIAGYLEFLHSDPELPKPMQAPIEKAIEQTNNMESLINDLLVLSKLEDKALQKKHLTTIHLKSHLETILQTLETSGKTNNHKLSAKCEKKLSVEASEKELNSVCYNLINNAVKYSEPGSEINVLWEKHASDYVKFSVTDNGIGIAPEHVTSLTERFYRVDGGRSRKVGGTGLGLSIVKHILERHHGRLEIHTVLGEGSTFSAIFPVHPLQQVDN